MQQHQQTELLTLPCPHCGEDILEVGFYNFCTESVGLRENNQTIVVDGRVYMDHDESGHQTTNHTCATEAFCSGCDTELPWALYEIRTLDGQTIEEARTTIAELMTDAPRQEGGATGAASQGVA